MAVVNVPLGGTSDWVIPISVGFDVAFLICNLFVLVGMDALVEIVLVMGWTVGVVRLAVVLLKPPLIKAKFTYNQLV